MNIIKTPTLSLTILLLLFALEISFSKSILLNLFLVVLSLFYLVSQKKWYGLIGLLIIPVIPALSTYWSVMVHGSGSDDAWLLLTRTFAFSALGMMFAFGIDLEELLLILEQKKVPASFIYGILVVLHATSDIKREVVDLKEASLLRGKRLTIFSPILYLKTIFVAFNWRDDYTEALISRGFDETSSRQYSREYQTSKIFLIVSFIIFIVGNSLLFLEN